MNVDNTLLNEQVVLLKKQVKAWEFVAKQLIEVVPLAALGNPKEAVVMTVNLLKYSLENVVVSAEDAKGAAAIMKQLKEVLEGESKPDKSISSAFSLGEDIVTASISLEEGMLGKQQIEVDKSIKEHISKYKGGKEGVKTIEDAKIILEGKEYEYPTFTGSEGEKAIDISNFRSQTGYITMDTGYVNTGSTTSAITYLNGEAGILRYSDSNCFPV